MHVCFFLIWASDILDMREEETIPVDSYYLEVYAVSNLPSALF
jgi:hypothetical protein